MRRLLFAVLLLASVSAFAGTGRVIIVNIDGPGTGFNDPTPATPVGGNPGTTLGAQRLNVFQKAADRWSHPLDTNVDIVVQASFAPIPGCTATEGTLGFARALQWRANFPGAPRQNVWYPSALANKFANTDLFPGVSDIEIHFNAAVDNATCLGDSDWYYGFDGNEGGDTSLYSVVLHEIAHGLGVSGRGAPPSFFEESLPSIYDTHTLDLEAGRRWDQMSEAQRQASMTNTGQVVWDGENVKKAISQYLIPVTTLTVTVPAAIARDYDIGTATFGPRANTAAMTGTIVQATDAGNAEGPSPTDGCSAYTNGGAISGKIALVDRGTCTFVQKAVNAQAAGAIGLIVADNQRATCIPPGMGSTGDVPEISIPIISVSMDDGAAIKGQLGAASINAMLRVDPSRLAGTSAGGYVRLYAPCTLAQGSSIYHFDVVATPNLLMEPFINSDLLNSLDLTLHQLIDMGWSLPPRSGRRALKR